MNNLNIMENHVQLTVCLLGSGHTKASFIDKLAETCDVHGRFYFTFMDIGEWDVAIGITDDTEDLLESCSAILQFHDDDKSPTPAQIAKVTHIRSPESDPLRCLNQIATSLLKDREPVYENRFFDPIYPNML